jgi:nucleoside-diphosphate-sugar epimerase
VGDRAPRLIAATSRARLTVASVLIVGASGVIGAAAVEAFAAAGWDVIAWSRRRPLTRPETRFRHVTADLRDDDAAARAVAAIGPVTHVVYTALHEQPELIAGWTDREHMAVNLRMLRNVLDPLVAVGEPVHITLLQGTKAYGSHIHDIPTPAREDLPRDDHANFYWLQEDLVRATASTSSVAFTILRPQLVVGGAIGVATNPIGPIGAYASLCREAGRPCGFPGGGPFIWEAVDTRVLAAAMVWAAEQPAASAGETFNVTNGDVFTWRDLWPALMTAVGAEPGPDEPLELREFFAGHREDWLELTRRRGLRPIPLDALLGQADQAIDYYFAAGQANPRDKLVSTVKIREAGFAAYLDTAESFDYWLRDLQYRGYLPTP